jgi:hypothetical protein
MNNFDMIYHYGFSTLLENATFVGSLNTGVEPNAVYCSVCRCYYAEAPLWEQKLGRQLSPRTWRRVAFTVLPPNSEQKITFTKELRAGLFGEAPSIIFQFRILCLCVIFVQTFSFNMHTHNFTSVFYGFEIYRWWWRKQFGRKAAHRRKMHSK